LKKTTHLIFGAGITIYLIDPSIGDFFPILLVAIISSNIPDIDLKFKHRRLLHNVFAPVVISIIINYFLTNYDFPVISQLKNKIIASFLVGYYSHLFLDSLTYRGIDLFWPLQKKSYGIKSTRFDNIVWNFIVSFIGILFLVLWVAKPYFLP